MVSPICCPCRRAFFSCPLLFCHPLGRGLYPQFVLRRLVSISYKLTDPSARARGKDLADNGRAFIIWGTRRSERVTIAAVDPFPFSSGYTLRTDAAKEEAVPC